MTDGMSNQKIIENPIKKYKHLTIKRWYIQSFNGTPALLHLAGKSIVSMKKGLGFSYTACMSAFEDDLAEVYYNRDDLHFLAHKLEEEMVKNPNYLQQLINKSEERKDEMLLFIKEMIPKLPSFSEQELIENYQKLAQLHADLISESHIIEGYSLTRDMKFKAQLLAVLDKKGRSTKFNEYFITLTKPIRKSFINDYNNILASLIDEIKKNEKLTQIFLQEPIAEVKKGMKNNKTLNHLLQKLTTECYWIRANYKEGKHLCEDDFIAEIKIYLNERERIEQVSDKTFTHYKEEKEKLIKELALPNELAQIIRITDILTYWQDDRKKYILQGCCAFEDFLSEISKRFSLDVHLLRYLLPEEMNAQELASLNESLLLERWKGCIVIYDKGVVEVFTGQYYHEFRSAMKKHKDGEEIKEVTGMCASIGKVSGVVHICRSLADIKEIKKGEILVTGMTRPEFVPAMQKAAAIVTDEGGITSHAAVISRELKKPCVIGTKIATKVLKNGMFVEVNANHGLIKIVGEDSSEDQ
ncbi:hypothetical protein HYW21_05280 [Candidatus Woesearchaeota archaeon]|nr:hypothetical protein [Candidatus Woesearchaeota archaeon]